MRRTGRANEHGVGQETICGLKMLRGSLVDERWKKSFRIFRNIFQYSIRLVGPDLAKNGTTMRKALSLEKRIAVAL